MRSHELCLKSSFKLKICTDSVWNRSKWTPVYSAQDIFLLYRPLCLVPDTGRTGCVAWFFPFILRSYVLQGPLILEVYGTSAELWHLSSQLFSYQQIAILVPSIVYMCVGRPRHYLCTLTFWGPIQIALRAAIIQPLSWDIIAIYCTHIKYFSKTGDGTGKTGRSCTASKWP